MGNYKKSPLPRRQAAGGESRNYRLDAETLQQLQDISGWFEAQNLSYSDSVMVRAAIREYLLQLQRIGRDGTSCRCPGEVREAVRRAEEASGVSGRRIS